MGFPTVGNATNESGILGAFGLFRKGYNYLLVSGTSFIGQTEISNAILATTAAMTPSAMQHRRRPAVSSRFQSGAASICVAAL